MELRIILQDKKNKPPNIILEVCIQKNHQMITRKIKWLLLEK